MIRNLLRSVRLSRITIAMLALLTSLGYYTKFFIAIQSTAIRQLAKTTLKTPSIMMSALFVG